MSIRYGKVKGIFGCLYIKIGWWGKPAEVEEDLSSDAFFWKQWLKMYLLRNEIWIQKLKIFTRPLYIYIYKEAIQRFKLQASSTTGSAPKRHPRPDIRHISISKSLIANNMQTTYEEPYFTFLRILTENMLCYVLIMRISTHILNNLCKFSLNSSIRTKIFWKMYYVYKIQIYYCWQFELHYAYNYYFFTVFHLTK